jgi:SAM-dependent methyltransferase
MEDVSALVARLYEGHPYPPPTDDIAASIAQGRFQMGDPPLWQPMLWPEGRPRERLKILVAGCGSEQAAWFAYTNRESEVFGVDLSEASLSHHRFLQDKHELANLRLFKGDLREVAKIGADFDLVICTGVLHHMADPSEGVRALAAVMARHATLACMLYATPRRAGVYMMQDAFRRLGITADADGVGYVRRTLATLPDWHFARFYMEAAPELQHDAAIVDTFLHPQDRPYTVPQLLALVEENGLFFQGWFENGLYHAEAVTWFTPETVDRIKALPLREQWAVVEQLNAINYTHYFLARRSKPPKISFTAGAWERMTPHHHPATRRASLNEFRRANYSFNLTPSELAQFEMADDRRTLGDIARARHGDTRALFERLWKQGHVMLSRL